MHPSALLLLLRLSSLLQVIRLAAATTTNGTGSNTSCVPARCGDLNITYPFSLAGVQPLECGFPVFDLTCDWDAGRAYLSRTFRERLYHVKNIFYDNNSLVVAVETAFAGDETCHIPDFNLSSSLALFPLNISRKNKDLNFVYNCDNVPPQMKLPQKCADRTMGAYFSDDTEAQNVPSNCSLVSVPVRGFQAEKQPARNYVQMISEGFLVEWPTMGDCDACRKQGGECRFVQPTFQCVCRKGLPCSQGEEQI